MGSSPNPLATRIAASSRRVRAELETEGIPGVRAELGASVAGQAMTGFCLWLSEVAREDGIDSLLFLARDGELPLAVAKELPKGLWGETDLLYLHVSRATWSLAAAAAQGVDVWISQGVATERSFLVDKSTEVPRHSLFSRVGCSPQEIEESSIRGRLLAERANEPLSSDQVANWARLLEDPDFQQVVQAKASARLSLIESWLEGLSIPKSRLGLVDVGWTGQLALHLGAILDSYGANHVSHYHFGGRPAAGQCTEVSRSIRRFAFEPSDSFGDGLSSPVTCVETITANGAARLVDFDRSDDGEVRGVFAPRSAPPSQLREEMWDATLRVARGLEMKNVESFELSDSDLLKDPVARILESWWTSPRKREVAEMLDMTFEHDESGHAERRLVDPYQLGDLIRPRSSRLRQWPEGSEVASSPIVRGVLRLLRPIHRIFRAGKSRLHGTS